MNHQHRRPWRLRVLIAALLMAALAVVTAPAADAQSLSDLDEDGPHRIDDVSVSDVSTPGFGAADIYYPTDGATYGGVVIFPGYTATRSTMAWLARRVASHGFIVLNANTNSTTDFPASRGTQMLAAVDYLANDSALADRVDGSRMAVMGHSMGGGGTLEAIADDPSIDAAVPLTPWSSDKSWPEVTTPTLIIGAENDAIAPVNSHAIPFYESIPDSTQKAYVEIDNAGHTAPNTSNATVSAYSVAWLKGYVDGDQAYVDLVCGSSGSSSTSDYRTSCSTAGGGGDGGGSGGGGTGDGDGDGDGGAGGGTSFCDLPWVWWC